mgnify:CR=1 FL=1
MFLIEPILLGVSLAMDALAVSMALGAAERKNFTWSKILITALSLGLCSVRWCRRMDGFSRRSCSP